MSFSCFQLPSSIFIAICFILVYRVTYFPAGEAKAERLAWLGLFLAELWFSFYWSLTLIHKWNPVFRFTFKDRLSSRSLLSTISKLCTVNHGIEPPIMVTNTVLSVMAYDYPPQKLSVYLSDDGYSKLTFYALLEAVHFSKIWLPFCRKFEIEPRSPEAYFRNTADPVGDSALAKDWLSIKKSYEDLKTRIETITKLGRIPVDIRKEQKGFHKWGIVSSQHDHQTILQDEEKGHEIVYVQYPQSFHNLCKNDLYSSSLRVIVELELLGFDANGGPSYIGTGCFHRRASLWERRITKKLRENGGKRRKRSKKVQVSWKIEAKSLQAAHMNRIQTGEMRGWRSIYFNPERKAFLAENTVAIPNRLIQHKRWAEAWENLYVVEAQSEVADEKISRRYEQEVMEFGTPSVMFTILPTLAQLYILGCILGIRKLLAIGPDGIDTKPMVSILLCKVVSVPLWVSIPFFAFWNLSNAGSIDTT
ncbi:Cellulose synthase like E1 [Hibiscus syriacus]|uniref:Cellulose synthase like E1 n=1 Tax=Hibiscus syriacus TaxID=106335 RepID=A0A6A3C4W4_HIBSY|nr:Cellulose synthase like E1 [Hibiscus syriacus]